MKNFEILVWVEDPFDATFDRFESFFFTAQTADEAVEMFWKEHESGHFSVQCVMTKE